MYTELFCIINILEMVERDANREAHKNKLSQPHDIYATHTHAYTRTDKQSSSRNPDIGR